MPYPCHIHASHELIGINQHKWCVQRLRRGLCLQVGYSLRKRPTRYTRPRPA